MVAGQLAEDAEFFSFGTNDLTQMAFGMSRDDAEIKFMAQYLKLGILKEDPFETIDVPGEPLAPALVHIAVGPTHRDHKKQPLFTRRDAPFYNPAQFWGQHIECAACVLPAAEFVYANAY